MSNTVSFAGNLTGDLELAHTREGGKPYVTFRVMVNHRFQNAQGEWQKEEPHRTTCASTAVRPTTSPTPSAPGPGAPVTVHGRLKTDSWADQETGEKRSTPSRAVR